MLISCPYNKKQISMRNIEHEGVVDQVSDDKIKVKLMSVSACASCHTRGACSMSESQEKEIEVERRGDFKPGDRVIIEGAGWQGLAATWWAYVLPVLLVLTTLIITYTISGREGLAGFFSLLILLPYYLVLKISDKIMSKSFHFTIKQVNE